ncbi:DUF58 domain-containing protein [Methylomagnum ishizawai]|uniref:DUF58 domain-containing protein n=1 Tax=Methylomagnum ishizawai TaxID=1760988 RepID=UPI001C330C54|nr:DUF58 domain-containing protein [Methylomagnum ishizawai]BBL76945.1 hypothetical protein MishRS11D_40430 [Methylomagnum ishizawai]
MPSAPLPAAVRPGLDELIRLSQPAAGLSLARATVRALQSGQYLTAFKGRGMEFDETRPYAQGDDVRQLDWKVTARTGKPHTKLFREERERPVFLSVDYRAAMFFATRGMFKSAMAARLAALIAWSARAHGDRVGGQIFSEAGRVEFKPDHGHRAVLRLLKALVDQADPAAGGSAEAALEDALSRLPRHARPGSLVFVFSDFRHLNAQGEAALSRLARHCDGVLVMVSDPMEQALPLGRHRYAMAGRELLVDANRDTAAEHERRFLERQQRVRSLALGHGLRFVACRTLDDPLLVLQQGIRRHPA